MKAIIDGLRYDTEKADRIAEITGNPHEADEDIRYAWRESLWITPGGRFFLLGEGTPKTRWFRQAPPENRRDEGGIEYGWAIRALPEEDAKAWIEKYCTAATYELFWDVEDA